MPLSVAGTVTTTLQPMSVAMVMILAEGMLVTPYSVAERKATTAKDTFAVVEACCQDDTSNTPCVVARDDTMANQEDVRVTNQFVVPTECIIPAEFFVATEKHREREQPVFKFI